MKCLVFGFLLLGTAAGYSYVPPAGNQPGFLEVVTDIFLGKELKDYPNCGQPIQESDSSKRGLEKGKRQRNTERKCLDEEGKTIHTSPNYPSKYPDDIDNKTYIYSKRSFIKATFHYYDIESHPRCFLDVLEFRDTIGNKILERICGKREEPFDLFLNTRALEIKFKTDQVTTARGFCVKLDCGTEDCIKLTEAQFKERVNALKNVTVGAKAAEEAASKAEKDAEQANLDAKIAEEAKRIAIAEAEIASLAYEAAKKATMEAEAAEYKK